MLTNAEITIFNRRSDKDSKKFVYIPHYISDVWFHTDQKTSVMTGGLTRACLKNKNCTKRMFHFPFS